MKYLRDSEGRWRTGWRLLGFVLLFAALNALASLALRLVVGRPPRDPVLRSVALGLMLTLTATVAVTICRSALDQRSLSSLGLAWSRRAAADLLAGFLASALMLAGVCTLLFAGGWLQISPAAHLPLSSLLLLFLGVGASVGWWEEIVFRGYLLHNLRDGLGLPAAIAVSCASYGAIHLLNPDASLLSTVIIAAIGYLRIHAWRTTGQLWLSMGMHAGWNFWQGPVCGFPVSGRPTPSILQLEVSAPSWLGGGAFGPEAGLVVVPAVGVGLMLIEWWRRQGAPRG